MGIRKLNSLVKKWCLRYLFVVIIAIIGITGVFIYFKSDYERLAMQTLKARLDATTEFYDRVLEADMPMLYISSEIKDLTKDQFYCATLFNQEGELIFTHHKEMNPSESTFVLNEAGKIYMSSAKERLMTIDRKILKGNQWVGTLRFTSSLRLMDFKFREFVLRFSFIAVILLGILVLISYVFMRSMVRPLIEMKNIAQVYAKGNFDADITISRNDEIGQLAEAMQVMAKELKDLEVDKYQFIDTVSHELRTPMTSILGWCDLMEMRPELSDKGINMIKIETQRLGDLVSNLMAFNGLKTKEELKYSDFDLIELLDEVLLIFKPRMDRYFIEINKDWQSQTFRIVSDRGKFKQIIVNVLDNAMKFSEQNTTIEIGQRFAENEFCIWIQDQGQGILPEHLALLTQKYFRGGTEKPGMGLGLAIVKDLLSSMSGDMVIDSTIGKGTKVQLTFKQMDLEGSDDYVKLTFDNPTNYINRIKE